MGGYKVCEKWLKDRRGRQLSFDDLMHYQKVIVALAETRAADGGDRQGHTRLADRMSANLFQKSFRALTVSRPRIRLHQTK